MIFPIDLFRTKISSIMRFLLILILKEFETNTNVEYAEEVKHARMRKGVCESGLRVTFALDDRLDKIHMIPVYSYFAVIPRPVFTLHHQYPWNGNRNIGGRNLKCVYQVYPEFELILHVGKRVESREETGIIAGSFRICYFSRRSRTFFFRS